MALGNMLKTSIKTQMDEISLETVKYHADIR